MLSPYLRFFLTSLLLIVLQALTYGQQDSFLTYKFLENYQGKSIYQFTLRSPVGIDLDHPPGYWRQMPLNQIPASANNTVEDPYADFELGQTADADLTDNRPRWHVYLETSDDKYFHFIMDSIRIDSPITFIDTFDVKGEFSARLSVSPIYSPTEKPRDRRQKMLLGGSSNGSTKSKSINLTNFPTRSDTLTTWGEVPLPAVIPGDTTLAIINVRNTNQQASLPNQYVDLVVPGGYVKVLQDSVRSNTQFILKLSDERTAGSAQVEDARLWRWRVPTLTNGEERTIFVPLVVDRSAKAGTLTMAYGFHGNRRADISTSYGVLPNLSSPEREGESPRINLPSLREADGNKTVYQSNEPNYATELLSLAVNKSRDPNRLVFYPDFLYVGDKNKDIRLRSYFQNIGSAPVIRLLIDYEAPDPLFELGSYSMDNRIYLGPGILPTNAIGTIGYSTGFPRSYLAQWNNMIKAPLSQSTTRKWLPGRNAIMRKDDIIYTMGYIDSYLSTKTGYAMKANDLIRGRIKITMDGDTLSCRDVIRVVNPPKYHIKPDFGGKIGVNLTDEVHVGHAGLFVLFPLTGVDKRTPPGLSRLSASALPEWYLQIEALYNRLEFPPLASDAEYSFTSIDFPVQVRYAPRALNRLLGISLGLTPSYVMTSDNEAGGPPSTERGTELYGHVDLSTGNFIDDRFLSFGLRANLLLNDGINKSDNERYFQLYAQYGF